MPNPIPDAELAKLQRLLQKQTRTEDEWTVIKDMPAAHDVYVILPQKPGLQYPVLGHVMMVEGGHFTAFTNATACKAHIAALNAQDGKPGRMFAVGVLTFDKTADFSDLFRKELYIDFVSNDMNRKTTFMIYHPKTSRIPASRVE